MKLLFYIRQTHGEAANVAKHPDYIFQKGQNDGSTAFFESSSPARMISNRIAVNRLDKVIGSFCRTLPYVCTTIELIDRAPSSLQGEDIHTYLGIDKCGIICAFATFERLQGKKILLQQIFNKIADETSHPDEIFNYQENLQSMGLLTQGF